MFLNETMHPRAVPLHATLLSAEVQYNDGDERFYLCMEQYRQMAGWSEEKMADLYARILDGLDGMWHMIPAMDRTSILSRCLWANDRIYTA